MYFQILSSQRALSKTPQRKRPIKSSPGRKQMLSCCKRWKLICQREFPIRTAESVSASFGRQPCAINRRHCRITCRVNYQEPLNGRAPFVRWLGSKGEQNTLNAQQTRTLVCAEIRPKSSSGGTRATPSLSALRLKEPSIQHMHKFQGMNLNKQTHFRWQFQRRTTSKVCLLLFIIG